MDRTDTGDDAVGVGTLAFHAEVRRAVTRELIELGEGILVQQPQDALPGGHLSGGVLLFDGRGGCGIDGLVDPPTEVGDLSCRGVDVDLHKLRLSVTGDKRGVGPLSGMDCGRADRGRHELPEAPRHHRTGDWLVVWARDELARSTTAYG